MAETEKILRLDVSWPSRPNDRNVEFIERIQAFLTDLENFDSRFGGLSFGGRKMNKNAPDFRTVPPEKISARLDKKPWVFSLNNQRRDPFYSLIAGHGMYIWPDVSNRPWPDITSLEFSAPQQHGIWTDEKWALDFMQLWIEYWDPTEATVYNPEQNSSFIFIKPDGNMSEIYGYPFWMRWFREGGEWHWEDKGQSVGPPAQIKRFLNGKLLLWPHFAPTEPAPLTIDALCNRRLKPEETFSEFE